MNNVKKNNKGFSLVELIVVVLIMAIIAVALAPQVMKWVDNSRQAVDVQTKDSIVSAFTVASADKNVYGKEFKVVVTSSAATWSGDDYTTAISTVIDAIYDVTNARCKSTATTITVEMDDTGKVTGSITGVSTDIQ